MSTVMCVDHHEPGVRKSQAKPAPTFTQEQEIRVEKVLDVKRQLAEGRYNIADKLNLVTDRLLEDLLGRGCEP